VIAPNGLTALLFANNSRVAKVSEVNPPLSSPHAANNIAIPRAPSGVVQRFIMVRSLLGGQRIWPQWPAFVGAGVRLRHARRRFGNADLNQTACTESTIR
jgi:hypothetical protein